MSDITLKELEVIKELTDLLTITLTMLSQYMDISEYESKLSEIDNRV